MQSFYRIGWVVLVVVAGDKSRMIGNKWTHPRTPTHTPAASQTHTHTHIQRERKDLLLIISSLMVLIKLSLFTRERERESKVVSKTFIIYNII